VFWIFKNLNPKDCLKMILPSIPEINEQCAEKARIRQGQLTKPLGALGMLETISIQLAGITASERPVFHQKEVIIMAADHGITREGVSAYPSDVTAQMVLNFLSGGAAVTVLARQAKAHVSIVDIGVDYDFKNIPGLYHRKIAMGTRNMLREPAMTRPQAEEAIQVGIDLVDQRVKEGMDLVATGEMGIGNTTPSSAITAVYTHLPVEKVTGRGTGLDDAGLLKKIQIIHEVINFHRPDPQDPLDILSKIGGFEIAGLAGVILGAASHRKPIVIDGFISGAAALIAVEIQPAVKPYLIASHLSEEIGHAAILHRLGLKPLLNLGLRLGEGTGSVLAFNLVDAAALILDEMATFGEAGVSEKS
jgi:nicotinate-nucleotide--dimethylbenzimidazole phosphoribosyltransferase